MKRLNCLTLIGLLYGCCLSAWGQDSPPAPPRRLHMVSSTQSTNRATQTITRTNASSSPAAPTGLPPVSWGTQSTNLTITNINGEKFYLIKLPQDVGR